MPANRVVLPARRFFEHDEDGNEITRERACHCGRIFTQNRLATRMLHALSLEVRTDLLAKSDHGHVPVACPACERTNMRLIERSTPYGRTT